MDAIWLYAHRKECLIRASESYLKRHRRLCTQGRKATPATHEKEGGRASLQAFLIDVNVDECRNFGRRYDAATRRSAVD